MKLNGNVFSKVLDMDTGITIVTPNDLKLDGSYKVVYLLHGLCGNHRNWADYTLLPTYANDYDAIFIMPEVQRSFYMDMKYGLKYFSYITEELPEICKNIFNISSKREDTAIMGASMGGYGALKCALSKPDQYGFCGAFSPAFLFLKDYLDYQRDTGIVEFEDLKAIFGEGTPLKGGMPSGHSALAFSISTAIALITEKPICIILAYLMAFITAQSRVDSEVHTVFEVIVGGILGILLTLLIFTIFKL